MGNYTCFLERNLHEKVLFFSFFTAILVCIFMFFFLTMPPLLPLRVTLALAVKRSNHAARYHPLY
jgi:hypothetical protein